MSEKLDFSFPLTLGEVREMFFVYFREGSVYLSLSIKSLNY